MSQTTLGTQGVGDTKLDSALTNTITWSYSPYSSRIASGRLNALKVSLEKSGAVPIPACHSIDCAVLTSVSVSVTRWGAMEGLRL